MFTVRKDLSARAGAPPNTRVNPDTGVVETTNDDGTTWVDDPRSDPRQNPTLMLPPSDAPDVKCAAAAGMVENVRRVIDGAAGGTTVAGIATLLLTLLLIPGIGWMFAAMLLFASSFVAATAAAVLAAFTEDVYDYMLCSFYSNIDSDGKVSWAQLESVLADVSAEFSDVLVHDILAGIMQMHREVGFTNAGVVYADPLADCTSCAPGGRLYDFTIDPYQFVPQAFGATPLAVWALGVGWQSIYIDTGGNGYTIAAISASFSANIEYIEIGFSFTDGTYAATGETNALASEGFDEIFWTRPIGSAPMSPGSFCYKVLDPAVPVTVTQLLAQFFPGSSLDGSDPGGSCAIEYIKVMFVGDPPEGGVEIPYEDCE